MGQVFLAVLDRANQCHVPRPGADSAIHEP